MGEAISKPLESFGKKKEVKLIMAGDECVGKTTILYKLKLGETITAVPSLGFEVETIEYKNINFTIWALSGNRRAPWFWHHYYDNTEGVIYVVDCTNHEKIQESRDLLYDKLLNDERLYDVPFLFFANKFYLPDAMSTDEIIDKLDLFSIKQDWFIQSISALTGDGLYEGLEWLTQALDL